MWLDARLCGIDVQGWIDAATGFNAQCRTAALSHLPNRPT